MKRTLIICFILADILILLILLQIPIIKFPTQKAVVSMEHIAFKQELTDEEMPDW